MADEGKPIYASPRSSLYDFSFFYSLSQTGVPKPTGMCYSFLFDVQALALALRVAGVLALLKNWRGLEFYLGSWGNGLVWQKQMNGKELNLKAGGHE